MVFIAFVHGLILVVSGIFQGMIGLVFPATREVFVESGALLVLAGGLLVIVTHDRPMRLGQRMAFLLTASVWITAAAAGALPLWLWGLSWTDAFFEAMSGITTTGSTVMSGLDSTPEGINLWRGLIQWFGGVGFIVAGIALLPVLKVGGMQLYRTESSERGDNEMGNAARFAAATLWVYLGLTLVCAVAYRIGGMSGYEATVHAMTTLSTGGYSTSDASFGHFQNPALHWMAALFMLAGALPFAWYIRILRGQGRRTEQVPGLLALLAVSIAILTLWRVATSEATPFQALTEVTFNVVSVVTTTGFASTDYMTWGSFAIVAFFLLTAVGGCTGSTSGGVKLMRWIVLVRAIRSRILRVHRPHQIASIRYEGVAVGEGQLGGVIAFLNVFALTFMWLAASLAFLGLDPVTAASGALTAITNVGPGVGSVIGPAGNFSTLPDAAKWLLALGMYVGRLEMLTVFVLFMPRFWLA
ncbi:MAG: TrkH family potassium uptake protein [Rhodobacteraceae bacterium]|nr:TrkH family potassium uptake protein [Paracoccaceae bacterium]